MLLNSCFPGLDRRDAEFELAQSVLEVMFIRQGAVKEFKRLAIVNRIVFAGGFFCHGSFENVD